MSVPVLVLPDQHGEPVQLHAYRGRVVLLALSACWCHPCWDLAQNTEDLAAEYGDDLAHITVLLEDPSGLPVGTDEAAQWAEQVGVTGPVLADAARVTEPALASGFPTVLVLDRALTVSAVTDGADMDTLVDLVESELTR